MRQPTLGPYDVNYNSIIQSEDGTKIAVVLNRLNPPSPVDPERNANAEFLAASWELRETLDEVMQCWEEEAKSGDGIHEDHAAFYERAVKLLQRLGKRGPNGEVIL